MQDKRTQIAKQLAHTMNQQPTTQSNPDRVARLAVRLTCILVVACAWHHGGCPLASAQDETLATTGATEQEQVTISAGFYLEPDENMLTSEGEIVVDPQTGSKLPEEVNDGELEGGDHHIGWNYREQTRWAGEYPLCKGYKMRQSPIDIVTDKVVFNTRMQLEFIDYAQEVEFEYKNTHHSVSLVPISSLAPPTVRVNWIPGGQLYELQEIHFHWGEGKNKGSEHEINDQRAAAEMHMVHYRKGLDKTQIGSIENSVLVVGVFIESDAIEHNKLENLVARVGHVNGTDAQYKDANPENLINLLPENHHSFYTYNGSLTTPPCYEVVTWIIMSEPVYMAQERLEQLSNLEKQENDRRQKILSNRRDIQPLEGRPVYASFNTTDSTSLDPAQIGKRIGLRNGKLAKALNEYWARVNHLKVSVKRAYRSIGEARKKLLGKLGLKKGGAQAGQQPPPPLEATASDGAAETSE